MKRLPVLSVLCAAVGLVLVWSATTSAQPASRQVSAAGAAGSQTFTVNVDGRNAANESFLAYFPRSTTIHPGDTVVFHYVGVGEPHTVTFGTLADSAIKAFASLTPKELQAQTPPKSFLAVDSLLPNLFPQGPGDVVQSAANPCYMASGTPGAALCPASQHEQPSFDGTQSYYNSGWLDSGQKWTMHLSSSTSPGTYRFFCLLHREDMAGKIDVAPSSKTIMSPAAQFTLGQKQLASAEKPLAGPDAALVRGKAPVPNVTLPGTNPVLAGSGAQNSSGSIDQFGPKAVHIPVGGTVTWWMIGPHTVTFNSDKSDDDIRATAPDGTVHFNTKALLPANSPGEPTPGKPAFTSGIHFKLVASKVWNGVGFLNSGIFSNSFGPPVIEGYSIKFTRAGTYHYICTVHDRMKGTVVVGG
jgi:plastocyanin